MNYTFDYIKNDINKVEGVIPNINDISHQEDRLFYVKYSDIFKFRLHNNMTSEDLRRRIIVMLEANINIYKTVVKSGVDTTLQFKEQVEIWSDRLNVR